MRSLAEWLLVAAWFACAADDGANAVRVLQRELKRVFYVGIAAPPSAVDVVASFNRTVREVSVSHLAITSRNVTLQPLFIELPEDGHFRASLLDRTCAMLSGKRVTSLLILNSTDAAAAVTVTASYAGVPVIRSSTIPKGADHAVYSDVLPLEVRLQVTARETLHALRSTLLHTHWHTFTLLSQEDVSLGLALHKNLYQILSDAPLLPTFVTLPSVLTKHALFSLLAEVSRSTRGVMVMICNLNNTRMIMNEARRLNMLDGHFVWLWVNTDNGAEIFDLNIEKNETTNDTNSDEQFFRERKKRKYKENPNSKVDRQNSKETFNYSDGETPNNDMFNEFYSESKESNAKYINSDEDIISVDNLKAPHSGQNHIKVNKYETFYANDLEFRLNPTVQNFIAPNYSSIPKKRKKRLTHYPFGRYEKPYMENNVVDVQAMVQSLPIGLLAIRPLPITTDPMTVKHTVYMMINALRRVYMACEDWAAQAQFYHNAVASCWDEPIDPVAAFSTEYVRELRIHAENILAGLSEHPSEKLTANFQILNLISELSSDDNSRKLWQISGLITGRKVNLDTIVWPGGDIVVSGLSSRARSVFRIVTAPAPPFVMEGELDEDGQCLRGVPCHRLHTSDKDNLTLAFNEMETVERLVEEAEEREQTVQGSYFPTLNKNSDNFEKFFEKHNKKFNARCCYGLAMDLLENIAAELEFDFHLYIVNDGFYGTQKFSEKYRRMERVKNMMLNIKNQKDVKNQYRNGFIGNIYDDEDSGDDSSGEVWNGIVGDLISGAAHMSFSALSVSSVRSEVIDFSQPYFFSGVSILAAPKRKSEIPLLAFLLPFSPELWIAIFTSLNVTAIAVAIYEWLSPFGLNPWGRQRSKNFSIASALWVMWGLLCGHLVAFKAPKSWPNKFLINVWGGFSVIFVASYTANIAALIAGLFFQNAVDDYNERNLLSSRVGTARASVAEYYVQRTNPQLWQHMSQFSLQNVEEGIDKLRNGTLDLLISDTPILDYYRATDHGCKLQRIGESINQDTYAVGMSKGFPLKGSINALISKYISNGYMDILQEKWYGGLPCFKLGKDYVQPRPLGVAAVAGVFLLLGLGVMVGCLILILEHLFYKYTLPLLRRKPKGSIWRSRNIMFFSQKLYRFINCVELVSPHHAARELVHTLRQGQITSLFQKSVKRKEHEQRRRRKSKAQFFEMIQEIRRVQQQEKSARRSPRPNASPRSSLQPPTISPQKLKPKSPRSPNIFGLNVRRFSIDGILETGSIVEKNALNVGRRLSKGSTSPPDIKTRRASSNNGKSGSTSRDISPETRPPHLSWQDISEDLEYSEKTPKRCRSRGDGVSTDDKDYSGIEIRVEDVSLPPAPPFPRVSPRSGRSPLSKLTEQELVNLWRSSESELRCHLLSALNEKKKLEPG